jgi:hypothetical protein
MRSRKGWVSIGNEASPVGCDIGICWFTCQIAVSLQNTRRLIDEYAGMRILFPYREAIPRAYLKSVDGATVHRQKIPIHAKK